MSTRAAIMFNNLNVAFAHTNLLGDEFEQLRRLDESAARRSAYGTDLSMLGTGELDVGEENLHKRDLLVVTGILNYAQAITHRLMTPRGYHPADLTFGVPWYSYLGATYTNKTIVEGQLVLDITDELLRDRRTQSVEEVRVQFEGNSTINVECRVTPIGYGLETLDVALRATV